MRHVLRFGGRSERTFPTSLRGAGGQLRGRRFSAKPIPLGEELASALLRDILDANLDERAERAALRDWVRRALGSARQF